MISLIFAVDPNFLIGKGNDLPWDYKADLKYFREKTSGKTVLMGLETFKSILSRIHKPLP
ncbi:MAG: dihydrofolate reductase, partial [Candidatus Izemoplasmatales bacterium]